MPMPRPSATMSELTDDNFADVIVSRAPPDPGESIVPLSVQADDREVFFEELDAKLKVHHQELVDTFNEQLEGVRGLLVNRLEEAMQVQGTQLIANHEKLTRTLTGAWDEKIQTTQDKICERMETLQPMFPRAVSGAKRSGNDSELADGEVPVEEACEKTLSANLPFCPTTESITRMDIDQADSQAKRQAFSVGIKHHRQSITVENTRYRVSVAQIVDSHRFELFFTMVIFANAIFIGFQTDFATRGDSDRDVGFFFINTGFTLIFTIELALRLYVKGWSFFYNTTSIHWNYLDIVVVFVSLLEASLDIVVLCFPSESLQAAQDTSQFRVLRILRLTRLVRGLRITRIVRFVRALRTLVYQMFFTIKSMIWAIFLLTIILYLFAVVFTQAVTTSRQERGDILSADISLDSDDPLIIYWSTLPRSMLTLFMSITNGVDWEDVVRPLTGMHGTWVALFICFICFTQMAVLNVITGFFCQNAIEGAKLDQDLVTQTIIAQKKMYLEQINAIFSTMDTDSSGTITIQEFEDHLRSETTRAYFESLGVDASDVWTLFKLMDMDNGCQIELEEFVSGCMRLKGGAKGLDVAKLAYEHRFMCKQLSKFMTRTDDRLNLLTGGLQGETYEFYEGEGVINGQDRISTSSAP
mmetsp:Transcript_34701/g.91653  ORF Transcript_34701/g.91653 Transcript_34701/m.91653 type:complete len:642 (-) Transcript_34701:19-1944(-)